VARKLADLLPNPGRLLNRVRLTLTGGVLTALGLFSAQPLSATNLPSAGQPQEPLASTTIVDRSRKVGKLVLSLPGHAFNMVAQHRSHSSHASHASHVSGTRAPAAPRVPVPRTAVPETPPATPLPVVSPTPTETALVSNASFSMGTISKVDPLKRVVTIKESSSSREFAYRDNTVFYALTGVSQNLADVNERLPFKPNDKVRITWKTSDNRTFIATEIREQP
jgi:hypothetical protein